MAPTIYNLDSAELTTAAATGGLLRATGYPLYLLIGRFWSLIPIGDVGYRMNLFSAFNGALTVFLTDRILLRLKVGNWAAFGALGLLATAPFFWSLSLVAEVYTLHTTLMALLILLLMRWGEQPTSEALAVVTLALGLSMGHHLATALLVPGVVFYVLTTYPRQALAPRSVILALIGLGVGLSVYLCLPLRYLSSPLFNYAGTYNAAGQFTPVNLASFDGLWWLITGKSFAAKMFAYQGADLWQEVVWFIGHLTRAFFVIGIGPGLLGLGLLLRRNWQLGGMLFLMFACSAFFYIDYQVMDKETMFLPAYIVWAIWVSLGTQEILNWVNQIGSEDMQIWSGRILKGTLVTTVLLAALWTGPAVDLSDDWSARARGEAILSQIAPDALVLGWWDTVPVIQYLQLVEEQRPDVHAINRFLISHDDLYTLVYQEALDRPVYINQIPQSWLDTLDFYPVGPVNRVLHLEKATGEE